MKDVSEKGSIVEFGKEHFRKGGRGLLISGGCDEKGSVVLPDHIFREIEELKDSTDLLINLHTGLLDRDTADKVGRSRVDRVSFDVVLDDDTIRKVFHLKASATDYLNTLDLLTSNGIKVAPHILAGLDFGRISWEYDAVRELSKRSFQEVILLVLIPTRGTGMENVEPPTIDEVLALAHAMKGSLSGRLVLGCMRPKGMGDLEKGVLDLGFNGLVVPSRSTREYVSNRGWDVFEHETCCCF
ncbi:MAG: radical SAM protein [Thermoplasmatota archaeon]